MKSNTLHILPIALGWEKSNPKRILRSFIRDHYRIHYVTSGKGYVKLGEHIYTLTQGMGFIIFPGQPSEYYPDPDEPWDYFWLGISGFGLQQLFRKEKFSYDSTVFVCEKSQEAIQELLINICIAPIFPNAQSASFSIYVCDFIANMQPLIRKNVTYSHFFVAGLEYIHNNYAENITITEIATRLSIDRTHLFRLFKKNVQFSPQEYLIRYRLDKACDLLVTTADNVSQVAFQVGFNDLSDFHRQFKRIYNTTATQYRKRSMSKELGTNEDFYY